MDKILPTIRQSFSALVSFKILLLILLPPLVSFLGVLVFFVSFWGDWQNTLTGVFENLWLIEVFGRWFEGWGAGAYEFAYWSAIVFLVLIFFPTVFLFTVFITSVFVMPLILAVVSRADFKHLERKKGGTVFGSLVNTMLISLSYVGLFILSLPLWFIPGCQIILPILLSAWLNKKIFVYDVLQDFASREERRTIEAQEQKGLYGLGFLLGFMSYIPLAILFVPAFSALCYTYYCLNQLTELRSPRN